MGETKKVLHTDKCRQQTACPLKATASLETQQISVGSTTLPHQHLAHNIAQELVPQLHLLRDLIFGIKEPFAILNKAGEDIKGEATACAFPPDGQQEFSYSVEGPLSFSLLKEPILCK